MRTLLTGKQMKAVDTFTIREVGIPSMVLMERAAMGVAREARKMLEKAGISRVVALCGTGNNGADGVAAARMLAVHGIEAAVAIAGNLDQASEEFTSQLSIAKKAGVHVYTADEWMQDTRPCVLLDALFGVGLSRDVEGAYAAYVRHVNALRGEENGIVGVLAVDLASGINAQTGRVMGVAVQADVTVTFGWEKRGTLLYPGRALSGNVIVEDIGFWDACLKNVELGVEEDEEGLAFSLEAGDLLEIPKREAYSNKGSFGKVLIVAGCVGMCGAAYLSALSAYRTGAGLVKILTVEENRPTLQMLLPEAIMAIYTPSQLLEGREEFRKELDEECRWADVVVLGPGLGSDSYVEYLVEDILTMACTPVVVDADGLNAIAAHPYLTSYFTENIIITPHLGEMARLTGQSISQIQENLVQTAQAYAARYGITCVLKDATSVIASPEREVFLNASGTSAMAKAGSGDVLTGVIAGLLALGMEVTQAARLGAYVHGLAGELAQTASGRHGLLARELADAVGQIMDGRTTKERKRENDTL